MYAPIDGLYAIVDPRVKKMLKTETLNGYKKSEVFSNMEKSILSGNIEKAILWACELHSSGFCAPLYTRLYKIYIEEVNKSNIRLLPLFLHEFQRVDRLDKKIFSRNDQWCRNHIANLVCLLTFSTKNKLPKLPKITEYDLNMQNNKERILTSSLRHVRPYLHEKDPKAIIIPMSEILLNLQRTSVSKSLDNCLFWLSWLLSCEKACENGVMHCVSRTVRDVAEKWWYDFSWIIWEIILSLSKAPAILHLLRLFKRDFTKGKKKKKMKLLVYAFEILIDPFPKIDFTKPIISAQENKVRNKIVANINFQYLDVMQNTAPKSRSSARDA